MGTAGIELGQNLLCLLLRLPEDHFRVVANRLVLPMFAINGQESFGTVSDQHDEARCVDVSALKLARVGALETSDSHVSKCGLPEIRY